MPNAQEAPHQNQTIIAVTQENQREINRFLSQDILVIRHLDWFSPSDWIGQQPFLIEKRGRHIQAIMLAAPEVQGATWVRLFGVDKFLAYEVVWERLLDKSLSILEDAGIKQLAALGLIDWFSSLLLNSGFEHKNNITVLQWHGELPAKAPVASNVDIRLMRTEDLPEVFHIDQLAFSPLWQNSLAGLTNAYHQPGISTVAVKQGEIVAYQISTRLGLHGHLARLAVHPEHQHQQVASALVFDLINQFNNSGVCRVTVNTQADNMPSLSVYKKCGFQPTGELLPVYQHPV